MLDALSESTQKHHTIIQIVVKYSDGKKVIIFQESVEKS